MNVIQQAACMVVSPPLFVFSVAWRWVGTQTELHLLPLFEKVGTWLLLSVVVLIVVNFVVFVCSALCYFVFVFFSPFSIAITSLGEERANLSAFRTFVRFALVFVSYVSSSSSCLGRAAACDCGTYCTFLFCIPRPIGSGDIAISMASVRS